MLEQLSCTISLHFLSHFDKSLRLHRVSIVLLGHKQVILVKLKTMYRLESVIPVICRKVKFSNLHVNLNAWTENFAGVFNFIQFSFWLKFQVDPSAMVTRKSYNRFEKIVYLKKIHVLFLWGLNCHIIIMSKLFFVKIRSFQFFTGKDSEGRTKRESLSFFCSVNIYS